MSNSNGTLVLPNPLTPLAFLPPEAAYQSSVTQFASVGALSVLIWDILNNILDDYRIFIQSGFNIPVIAYLTSRIGALAYLLASNIFSSAPTGNCAVFEKIVNAWCPLATAGTAFLFFLRVRAVYLGNHIVVAVFFIAWLGLLAATILLPVGIEGGSVGPTKYCQDVFAARYTTYVQVIPLSYDTLVFAAISWRLCSLSTTVKSFGQRESLRSIFLGKTLSRFTKSLLRDGQVYYLIVLLGGIPGIVLMFSPHVPPGLAWLCTDPNLVVGNIMACRVYRSTRLGSIRKQSSTTLIDQEKIVTPIVFASIHTPERSATALAHPGSRFTRSETGDEESEISV